MCYDVQAKLEAQLKRAKRKGYQDLIKEFEKELETYYHVSGFAHPRLIIYTHEEPFTPIIATWGLIPFWVKDNAQKIKLWNNTLNARGESIFEKPSFRNSANSKRCLLLIDGFYEHHHQNGKTYPYFITRKDKEPLTIAGLWDEWLDKETGEIIKSFSIVTTKANELMAKIHNNPKLREPRMPLIVSNDIEDSWLNSTTNKDDIIKLIQPYPTIELTAHTVKRLRGKDYPGNVPEISDEFEYEELKF